MQTLERVCSFSGGGLRNLLARTREALVYEGALPVSAGSVERATRDARDVFIRSLRTAQRWELIRQVARTKRVGGGEDYVELLDHLIVMEYRDNDGPWFDVNPAVLEASPHGQE
jgi:hypothetical protein